MGTEQSIVLVAGEASSDCHGAEVMRALQRYHGHDVAMFGIGGRHMRAAGLEPLVWAEEMSVMGLTEVIGAIPRLLGYRNYLMKQIAARRPNVALLLDMPDFNLPIAKQLKAMGIPVIYFIGPQVWAWRPSRVEQLRAYVDELLVILPFEPAFYRRYGMDVRYVGHPLVDQLRHTPSPQQARQTLGLDPHQPILALLPGSRTREVHAHLPAMLEGLIALWQQHPEVQVLLPVASSLSSCHFQTQIAPFADRIRLVEHGDARMALSAANAAVVASGTATLEAGLLETPLVSLYKISALSFAILKRLVRLPSITLVNLILQQQVVPELLQQQVNGQQLAHYMQRLLFDADYYLPMRHQLAGLRQLLGQHATSDLVARTLTPYLAASRAP